jgi:hypothetical protein
MRQTTKRTDKLLDASRQMSAVIDSRPSDTDDEFDRLFDQASEEGWSTEKLERRLEAARKRREDERRRHLNDVRAARDQVRRAAKAALGARAARRARRSQPACTMRHRRASRPAPVRRRGSRRGTATSRGSPSNSSDPDDPGESPDSPTVAGRIPPALGVAP